MWHSFRESGVDDPNQAMWDVARAQSHRPPCHCSAEALYEIAVWALVECDDAGAFEKIYGPDLLSSSARRGNPSARFLLSKLCFEEVPFARKELHAIAKDGNSIDLARRWMKQLSDEGYADARLELACAQPELDLAELKELAGEMPEAAYRLGLVLAGREETRNEGIALIREACNRGVKSCPLYQLDEKFPIGG